MVPGHREAGPALDLGHGPADQAAGHFRHLPAIGADDVLVVAARPLEAGAAVPDVEALQRAMLG